MSDKGYRMWSVCSKDGRKAVSDARIAVRARGWTGAQSFAKYVAEEAKQVYAQCEDRAEWEARAKDEAKYRAELTSRLLKSASSLAVTRYNGGRHMSFDDLAAMRARFPAMWRALEAEAAAIAATARAEARARDEARAAALADALAPSIIKRLADEAKRLPCAPVLALEKKAKLAEAGAPPKKAKKAKKASPGGAAENAQQ